MHKSKSSNNLKKLVIGLNIIDEAKNVFEIEIDTLNKIKTNIGQEFILLVNMIENCDGRVIITGMGKSGHIGNKISATLSSLGTPSFFMHPSEAGHGDLGMLTDKDILIAISNSGETEEVIQLIPSIRKIGTKLISVTCKEYSTLGSFADLNIYLKIEKEACFLEIAPTSSTTATLVFGDALAVVLSQKHGFTKEKFGLYHPKGSLGKKLLLQVSDIMHMGDDIPKIKINTSIKNALVEMTYKSFGLVNVIDDKEKLVGIITAGDIVRRIETTPGFLNENVSTIMNCMPSTVYDDELAVQAVGVINSSDKKIVVLPVINRELKCVGVISVNDLMKAGIM